MKKISSILLMLAFCLGISAQNEQEYDNSTVFVWETDSIYLRDDYIGKTSFNPDMIGVDFSANKYYGTLTVTNNSDAPFDMDWDFVALKLNGDFDNSYEIEKPIVYTQEKQIENVPKNGKVYQYLKNCFKSQFFNMKEIKKALKKESQVPVTLIINFSIIYKGEKAMIEVSKQGICKKK